MTIFVMLVSYVDNLIDDIKNSLHTKVKKTAPPNFDKYGKGMQYATFRKSKNTQWFVFFTTYESNGELVYLVRHISNNHVTSHHL